MDAASTAFAGTRAMSRVDRRGGFTLLELVAVLGLATLVGGALVGVLLVQLSVARSVAASAARREGVRTTFAVISAELRRVHPVDIRGMAPDSLALRSFRGIGVPCSASGHSLRVAWRGDRGPDAAKDSALVITAAGERAVALTDGRPLHGCSLETGEAGWLMTFAGDVSDAELVLVYETGRYYLSSRALRYRLGAEGRQPLTGEYFRSPATRFLPPSGAGGISWLTALDDGSTLVLRAALAPAFPP